MVYQAVDCFEDEYEFLQESKEKLQMHDYSLLFYFFGNTTKIYHDSIQTIFTLHIRGSNHRKSVIC